MRAPGALTALGVALAVGGFGAALLWPSLAARNSGTELARLEVFDRADGGWERGWRPVQFRLTPRDNPVRVVIEAEFLPGNKVARANTSLYAAIARDGRIETEGAFAMSLPNAGGGDRSPRLSSIVLPQFVAPAAGLYTLTVRSRENGDEGFARAEAVVRGGSDTGAQKWRMPGFIALGAGLSLLVADRLFGRPSRRRGRRR